MNKSSRAVGNGQTKTKPSQIWATRKVRIGQAAVEQYKARSGVTPEKLLRLQLTKAENERDGLRSKLHAIKGSHRPPQDSLAVAIHRLCDLLEGSA